MGLCRHPEVEDLEKKLSWILWAGNVNAVTWVLPGAGGRAGGSESERESEM